MYDTFQTLLNTDPELASAMASERERQEAHLELIASENYTSPAVMMAQGSVLTNKYAEGYPGKRYYGGCVCVDEVETLAIERAKKLFSANYANVQPHSGAQANAAVYLALLNPGDTLLGMSLSHGGHLTHGASVSASGKIYRSCAYGVHAETGLINYDEVAHMAERERPKLMVAGFSSYSRVVDWRRFREIADSCGALLMVDMAHVAGLVAAGLYPSPLPYADVVTSTTHKTLRGPRGGLILSRHEDLAKKLNSAVFPGTQGGPLMHVIAAKAVAFGEALQPSFHAYQTRVLENSRALARALIQQGFSVITGGTDNHLLVLSLLDTLLTGQQAEQCLERVGIITNKNAIPNDPRSPTVTSGLRVGTPAITTRGLQVKDVERIADWMSLLLRDPDNAALQKKIAAEVHEVCAQYPVYAAE